MLSPQILCQLAITTPTPFTCLRYVPDDILSAPCKYDACRNRPHDVNTPRFQNGDTTDFGPIDLPLPLPSCLEMDGVGSHRN